MVILHVRLEVLRQVVDAFAEERDLDFRGARVGLVSAVGTNNCGLTVVRQHVVPSTYGPAPEDQPRPPLYRCRHFKGGKEIMLAEAHGWMQKPAPAVGQGDQPAVRPEDADASGCGQ